MKQLVCNYAPVRFLPYREIGEFVNVGVVIHCPQTDYFDYRLVSARRTGRVTAFFPELDAKLFTAGLRGIERQLELWRIRAQQRSAAGQEELAPELAAEKVKWFREFVRRREGLLHYGEAGSLIANTQEEALDRLFGRYVERQFAHKREYQEIVMRDRLAQFLRDWKLERLYERDRRVGDEDFYVTMPFVHFAGTVIAKAIKPLNLNKAESSEIYHHGGTWVKNIERLKKREHMPPAVIFAVQFPERGKRLAAADEICSELRQLGVEPVDFADPRRIRNAVEVEVAA
jgi:Protein of unknown function (DUF3037)